MGLLRQFVKRVLTACVSRERLLTRGAPCKSGQRPRLALTFDDGPHPVHTHEVLDTLLASNLTGTFFIVGAHAERHPDLIRRIADEGHELGNHTWSHSEPARTAPREFLDEVKRTDDLIERLTGRGTTAMRPPKGEMNWQKLSGLWRMRKTVALWNIDPRDYRMQSHDEVSTWCNHYRPCAGDVLLFHDNHPWAARAVQELADRGAFENFQCVKVSELAGNREFLRGQRTVPVST